MKPYMLYKVTDPILMSTPCFMVVVDEWILHYCDVKHRTHVSTKILAAQTMADLHTGMYDMLAKERKPDVCDPDGYEVVFSDVMQVNNIYATPQIVNQTHVEIPVQTEDSVQKHNTEEPTLLETVMRNYHLRLKQDASKSI